MTDLVGMDDEAAQAFAREVHRYALMESDSCKTTEEAAAAYKSFRRGVTWALEQASRRCATALDFMNEASQREATP